MYCYNCGFEIKDGTPYYNHYFKSQKSVKPICQECFDDVYWNEVLRDPNTVIIDGIAYCHTEKPSEGGYNGRMFTIQMLDTGEIKRIGLWLNGKIPEAYWREDTAKFIA